MVCGCRCVRGVDCVGVQVYVCVCVWVGVDGCGCVGVWVYGLCGCIGVWVVWMGVCGCVGVGGMCEFMGFVSGWVCMCVVGV